MRIGRLRRWRGGRRVSWWLLALLLPCAVWLATAYRFLGGARRASDIRVVAARIRIDELEARRGEKDFLLRSLETPRFLREGESTYLSLHRREVESLRAEIARLAELVGSDPGEIAQGEMVDRLRAAVDAYESGFRDLVAAARRRGGEDWGLVGAWREASLRLVGGRAPPAASAPPELVSLLRLEADYRARPTEARATRLRGAIAASLAVAQEVPVSALRAYEQAFEACHAVEREIGLTEDRGLKARYRAAIHAVEPLVRVLLERATEADDSARQSLLVALTVGGAIMAALLGLALFYARSAAGRLRQLAWANRRMREDLAARIRAETELEEKNLRLLRSERLAAIGEMVAGLAHESGNALQRSQACLEMLRNRIEDRPGELELVDRIERAQDHIQHLHEQVRAYAAPIRLQRRSCDLRQVVDAAWEHLAPIREGRRADLTHRTSTASVRVEADPYAMEQVFRNLLENALLSADEAVRVHVDWEESESRGLPAVRCVVEDDGPGIPEEIRERIFEPFVTTRTRGTGLGLAITRRLVEAHGGRISVVGSGEPGASIEVVLPRQTFREDADGAEAEDLGRRR